MTAYKRIIRLIEELHSPYMVNGNLSKVVCNVCKVAYPCKTIQLLEEEAGNV